VSLEMHRHGTGAAKWFNAPLEIDEQCGGGHAHPVLLDEGGALVTGVAVEPVGVDTHDDVES
jgi:hypothetical protein